MARDTEQSTMPEEIVETKPAPRKRAKSKKTLVNQVIRQFGEKIENNELKPTVGDFIRLLQLEKELLEKTPKEIKVSWVEAEQKEHAPEK
jgi:hypothetical protein